MFEKFLKHAITLLLIAYVVIVALCPSIKNPDCVMFVHENPWILLATVILSYYIIYEWDVKIGLLLLICSMAIYLDIIMIIKNK